MAEATGTTGDQPGDRQQQQEEVTPTLARRGKKEQEMQVTTPTAETSTTTAGNEEQHEKKKRWSWFPRLRSPISLSTVLTLLFIWNQVKNLLWSPTLSTGAAINSADSSSKQAPILNSLYSDLYGGHRQFHNEKNKKKFSFWDVAFGGDADPVPPSENTGIPALEYVHMTSLNQKYDSYRFSVRAAAESRAHAAAEYRQTSLDRAFHRTLLPKPSLGQDELAKLELLEQDFIAQGSKIMEEMKNSLQASALRVVWGKDLLVEQKKNGPGLLNSSDTLSTTCPLHPSLGTEYEEKQHQCHTDETGSDENRSFVEDAGGDNDTTNGTNASHIATERSVADAARNMTDTTAKLELLNLNMEVLNTRFTASVKILTGIDLKPALEADKAVTGRAGRLLRQIKKRTLSATLGGYGRRKPKLYITHFHGDLLASQVSSLREEITAILRSAEQGDEVLVVVNSAGGTVSGYGAAAGQLLRIKQAGFRLTVAVEQVAASGGYMASCVADKIICSPFAVLGSIGVVRSAPNVYERLSREGVAYQHVFAGEDKVTLSATAKITSEDVDKAQKEVDEIWTLFKDFVAEHRPQLDMEAVATGGTWFGTAALDRKLCDEMGTVDEVILDYIDSGGFDAYQVKYEDPEPDLMGWILSGGDKHHHETAHSVVRLGIRWLVKVVASEFRAASFGAHDTMSNEDPTQTMVL